MFSKVKSLYIEQYKGFKDFKMEFNENLNVLVGENGTGKTTLLEVIFNLLSGNIEHFLDDDDFKSASLETFDNRNILVCKDSNDIKIYINNEEVSQDNDFFNEQKILYFPSEVAFKNYELTGPTKLEITSTDVILNADKMSKDLKQFLINQKYQDLNDIAMGKSEDANRMEKYKKLYNNFFSDKEFVGIDNNTFEPIFRLVDTNEEITVEQLSSGEKQIFFKGGSLLQYGENKDIIVLIDEPETSMHPEWQQKILKFYRDININVQFVFATHSPHILSCCQKNEIYKLEKKNNIIYLNENIENAYGLTSEEILFDLFDLKSVRNIDVQKDIDDYRKLFCRKQLLNTEEKEKMENLKRKLKEENGLSKSDITMLEFDSNTSIFEEKFKKLGGNNA